jgi:ATP-dependent DNA helicase DinG
MTDLSGSEFIDLVQSAFMPEGVLARGTTQFKPRTGQTEMALAVARTIERGGSLVVEAGTGVGKTFAYLVPALLSGERVLLSTATKALQDQLFSRDLPQLLKVLALPLRSALLKGRSSYLCQQRLQTHAREDSLIDKSELKSLVMVREWSSITQTGDLSELGGVQERSTLWPLITSTRENCLGSQCPEHKACFVNNARKAALASDVVVINHHLFFADMAVKESGMAELLPSTRVVIFDEAHQLNEIGTQFLGEQLGVGQLLDLVRDILAVALSTAAGLCDWQTICSDLEKAARDLRLCIGQHIGSTTIAWGAQAPEGLDADEWLECLHNLIAKLDKAQAALATVSELAPDFPRLFERAGAFKHLVKHFLNPPRLDQVRWIELAHSGQSARLVDAPLDIAEVVREKLLGLKTKAASNSENLSQIEQANSAGSEHHDDPHETCPSLPKSWIFTSATLGNDPTLQWFTKPCGLQGSEILQVQSPFDYPKQSLLFIPKTMVKPSDPQHSQAVSELAVEVIDRLAGRTLILTTTNRALKMIADSLREHYTVKGGIEVLVQGQLPKRILMDRFRGAGQRNSQSASGAVGFVLVATASFWEGFDVPGDALQAVIIDKLPFPPPNDPMVQARCARIEREGGSAFNEYSVAEAAVTLKQGAGRLIRRESDRGVLVICDSRLMSTGYGRRLIKNLPPMRHEENLSGLLEFLEAM